MMRRLLVPTAAALLAAAITTTVATVFRDTNDSLISSAQFFSRATTGTLIKAKGTETSTTTITADEVQLEL